MRTRLRAGGAARFPFIAEGLAAVTTYLKAEQTRGRVAVRADIPTLSHTLIGACHLLFTDHEGSAPDAAALRRVVVSVLHGVL